MFEKKDMMVSVLVAENMVLENEAKYKKALKEANELHNKTLNSMKEKACIKGVLKIRSSEFSFGEPTSYYSNGVQLFTGDEVEFKSGKKGIVVNNGCDHYVYTNAETAQIVGEEKMKEMKSVFYSFEGYVLGDSLTITKHYNELTMGEEVAKGRKGASGFVVTRLSYGEGE